jgi:probable HAF family extracellular repeat protein
VPIDVPGAILTTASSINDRGQIVGQFRDANFQNHGYLYDNGMFTTIDPPGASYTSVDGINNLGQIVGSSSSTTQSLQGFLYDNGSFTTVAVPGSLNGLASGINDKGEIVGFFIRPPNFTYVGFVDHKGTFSVIDGSPPGSMLVTRATAINNRGQIVGTLLSRTGQFPPQGFLLDNGQFRSIVVPGAMETWPLGINDQGEIVGRFVDTNNYSHGFLDTNGIFTTVQIPDGSVLSVSGINNSGLFVGTFSDANGIHGFIDPPSGVPEPGSLLLLASGLGALAVLRNRRFRNETVLRSARALPGHAAKGDHPTVWKGLNPDGHCRLGRMRTRPPDAPPRVPSRHVVYDGHQAAV